MGGQWFETPALLARTSIVMVITSRNVTKSRPNPPAAARLQASFIISSSCSEKTRRALKSSLPFSAKS
tara:strand:+ start:439 stop:642 length:204 start_codon:yes stop_codon:yes gene_type:complete